MEFNEYPKMMYRVGGSLKVADKSFSCVIVKNKEDELSHIQMGYSEEPKEVIEEKQTPAKRGRPSRVKESNETED